MLLAGPPHSEPARLLRSLGPQVGRIIGVKSYVEDRKDDLTPIIRELRKTECHSCQNIFPVPPENAPGEGPAAAPAPAPSEQTRWTVAYEPAQHVIRLTDTEGKAAGSDDRPVRFLVMTRDRRTRDLEPLMVCGEPQFDYLNGERER
jgi:hypothetical protein